MPSFGMLGRIRDKNIEDDQRREDLRDWFAGQALIGYITAHPDADCGPAGYAHDAYNIADAMLAARGGSDE